MKFATADGRLFTLAVERYEFPDEELGPTEDNPADEFDRGRFLIVSHEFSDGRHAWQASGPTMTTLELQRFAEWLDAIQRGERPAAGVYFTERDLEFSLDPKSDSVIVHVFRDFIPLAHSRHEAIEIPFPLRELDLSAAIDSLKTQLAAFPSRPPLL